VKTYVLILARCSLVATVLTTYCASAIAQSAGTGAPSSGCNQIADPVDRGKCLRSHAKERDEEEKDKHLHSIAKEPDRPSGLI
jgi:hypothetical protein